MLLLEIKNRKLLEMLEEQKKRLRGVGSLDVSSSMSSTLGLRQVAPASVVNFNNNGSVIDFVIEQYIYIFSILVYFDVVVQIDHHMS